MNMISSADGMRIVPSAPAHTYKTYQILAPISTHFRDATCAEAECDGWKNGWLTIVPTGSEQDEYIRHGSGRVYLVEVLEGGLTKFSFRPDQRCFQGPHKLRIERPEIFLRRGGDWRGNPTRESYTHQNAADWTEDFSEHQDKINTAIERG